MDIAGLVNTSSKGLIMDALFNPSSKKSIDQIASDMLVNKEPIVDNYSGTLVNQEDSAAISNFASKLSSIDKELKAAGNTKGADGLRELAKQFASKPEEFNEFMKSVDNLDAKGFQKVFSTASDVADKGLSVEKFANTLGSISDEKLAEGFVDFTNKILDDTKSSDSDKAKVFNKLASAVATVEDSDLKQTEKDEALTGLFSTATKSTSLTELETALDKFLK